MADLEAQAKKEEGNAAFAAKQYDVAVALYTEAIALDPSNHIFYSNRSLAHGGNKDWRAAADDARDCLRLDPTFIKGFYRLAAAQIATGEYKTARLTLVSGLQVHPKNADLLKQMQAVEREMKNNSSVSGKKVDNSKEDAAPVPPEVDSSSDSNLEKKVDVFFKTVDALADDDSKNDLHYSRSYLKSFMSSRDFEKCRERIDKIHETKLAAPVHKNTAEDLMLIRDELPFWGGDRFFEQTWSGNPDDSVYEETDSHIYVKHLWQWRQPRGNNYDCDLTTNMQDLRWVFRSSEDATTFFQTQQDWLSEGLSDVSDKVLTPNGNSKESITAWCPVGINTRVYFSVVNSLDMVDAMCGGELKDSAEDEIPKPTAASTDSYLSCIVFMVGRVVVKVYVMIMVEDRVDYTKDVLDWTRELSRRARHRSIHMTAADTITFSSAPPADLYTAHSRVTKKLRKNICQGCQANQSVDVKLSECARCSHVSYCSKGCQQRDWPRHKHNCKKPSKKCAFCSKPAKSDAKTLPCGRHIWCSKCQKPQFWTKLKLYRISLCCPCYSFNDDEKPQKIYQSALRRILKTDTPENLKAVMAGGVVDKLSESAAAGNAAAATLLGRLHEVGEVGVPDNVDRAHELYVQAVDSITTGDTVPEAYEAAYFLAQMYEYGNRGVVRRSYDRAFELYKLAADNGVAAAQNAVGYYCMMAKGGIKRDFALAYKYFGIAAEAGIRQALGNLGALLCLLHDNDRGLTTIIAGDLTRAETLLSQACDADVPEAMVSLSQLLLPESDKRGADNKTRLDSDVPRAVKLLERAINLDDDMARDVYAEILFDGKFGVIRNKKRALELWRRAANNGLEQAKSNMRKRRLRLRK